MLGTCVTARWAPPSPRPFSNPWGLSRAFGGPLPGRVREKRFSLEKWRTGDAVKNGVDFLWKIISHKSREIRKIFFHLFFTPFFTATVLRVSLLRFSSIYFSFIFITRFFISFFICFFTRFNSRCFSPRFSHVFHTVTEHGFCYASARGAFVWELA